MKRALELSAFLLLLSAAVASACDVPVFEYALENWPADSYVLVVFPGEKPSEEDSAVIAWLKKTCEGEGVTPNLALRVIDKLDDSDPAMRTLWEKLSAQSMPEGPKAALVAPAGMGVIWSGRLTQALAQSIVDSPARKEVARRLLSGHAGVWVLVAPGGKPDGDAAAALLKAKLAEANQALQATAPISVQETEAATAPAMRNVEFSLLRIGPNDPKEEMFVAMLMTTAKKDAAGPAAFPIFGRGRALCGLSGKDLVAGNIMGVCEFLIGDCSCEVKNQNPGVDMLMWTDWENRYSAGAAALREGPAPSGLTALAAPLESQPAEESSTTALTRGWPIIRNVLLALAGVAVAGGLLALAARKKKGPPKAF